MSKILWNPFAKSSENGNLGNMTVEMQKYGGFVTYIHPFIHLSGQYCPTSPSSFPPSINPYILVIINRIRPFETDD